MKRQHATTQILLTGFEAFAAVEKNPSWQGIAALGELPAGVEALELPVAWDMADKAIAAALERLQPKIVLSLGVHGGGEASGRDAKTFYIEELAHNSDSASIGDNKGHRRQDQPIDPSKPLGQALRGDHAEALLAALESSGFESEISQDAGRYLCNHTYYRFLEARDRGEIDSAAFVHVPPTIAMHPQGLNDDDYPKAFQSLLGALLRTPFLGA